MKNLFLSLLITVVTVSCSSTGYRIKDYRLGVVNAKTVGSVLLAFEEGVKSDRNRSGHREDLIYAGIDHNVIQILHREYNVEDDRLIIRDAFTQVYKYDISETKQITFRNYRITIIAATSEAIAYAIDQDNVTVDYAPSSGIK